MARQYYKDSTTGQMKPLGVKVEDTLPIGTIIDYDGTDIPEGYEEVDTEVILYENETGSSDTITLSDSLANYKYILIEFGALLRDFMLAYEPNGKYLNLHTSYSDSGGQFYSIYRTIYANANTLTTYQGRYGQFNNGTSTHENRINIFRVIGYKEV